MDAGRSVPLTRDAHQSRLPRRHLGAGDGLRHGGRPCRLDRFHADRPRDSSVIRLVKGQRGKVAMRLHLALRFDYGATVPWVTQLEDGSGLTPLRGRARWCCVPRSPLQGKNFATVAEFDVVEGECVPFVMTHGPSHLPTAPRDRLARGLAGNEIVLARWSARCSYAGRLEGSGPALVVDA